MEIKVALIVAKYNNGYTHVQNLEHPEKSFWTRNDNWENTAVHLGYYLRHIKRDPNGDCFYYYIV